MSVRIKSKIMRTPIKVGVRTYATYANCRTLISYLKFTLFTRYAETLNVLLKNQHNHAL